MHRQFLVNETLSLPESINNRNILFTTLALSTLFECVPTTIATVVIVMIFLDVYFRINIQHLIHAFHYYVGLLTTP